MAAIQLQGVQKRYANYVAVRNLDLEIKDGEFLILLGPSGCGKTTTLRCIAGLETPNAGDIRIGGESVMGLPPARRDLAFVFQMYALYPHFNVFENIAFPLRNRGTPHEEVKARVMEVAEILRLRDVLDKSPSALSAGSRQKVALARAMVRRPMAFLMDEPLGSLDSKFREKMRVELKRLHLRLGATLVYVTHDQLEAMSMGDRIAIMHNGVLQQVAPPREIYEQPANLFVAGFIGAPGMNLCPGKLQQEGGVLRVTHGNQAWPLPTLLAAYLESVSGNDGRIVLGIRPENLLLRESGQGILNGSVTGLEPMGPYNLITVECGGESIRLRVDRAVIPRHGDNIHFDPAPGTLKLFHAESGQAIGSGMV